MEVEIRSQEENKLLNRLEVRFRVRQEGGPTPTRDAIREALAKQLKLKDRVLVVDHVRSEFGKAEVRGYAKVYASLEDARRVERLHVLARNKLAEAGG